MPDPLEPLPPAPVVEEEQQPEFKHYAAGYALIFVGMIGLALVLVLLMKFLR